MLGLFRWEVLDYVLVGVIALIIGQQVVHFCLKFMSKASMEGLHVVITGGSQGLGLCLGVEFARLGSKVTLMARNKDTLQQAKDTISAAVPGAAVNVVSVDVTDMEGLRSGFAAAEKELGIVEVLVTCAGFAPTGYFNDVSIDQFRKGMELNYFGTVNALKAVLPGMQERKSGRVVFVSSGLALTAMGGYSAYAPTKWAVRGLADTLRNELVPYGINIHNAYPPGMDTPGYAVEQRTKPWATQEIEKGETLYKPDAIAKSIIGGVQNNEYHNACGDVGVGLLVRLMAGMSPRSNTVLDALLAPVLVFVGQFVYGDWDSAMKKTENKKQD